MAADYGFSKADDLYAALGYGKFSARQVLQKLAPDADAGRSRPNRPAGSARARPTTAARRDGDAVIRVKGFDDLLVYRAQVLQPD